MEDRLLFVTKEKDIQVLEIIFQRMQRIAVKLKLKQNNHYHGLSSLYVS